MKRIDLSHLPPALADALETPRAGRADDHGARDGRDRDDRVAAFARTVPETFRWAAMAAPDAFQGALTAVAPQATHVLGRRHSVMSVEPGCRMLVVGGPAGAGKTILSVARARMLVDAGTRAIFVDALDLATAHRHAGFHECTALERAKAFSGLVVFDDLGQELRIGHGATVPAIDLVRARHAAGRKTIVTTGFRSADLRRDYDDAFVRRLTEPGRAVVVRLGAESAVEP